MVVKRIKNYVLRRIANWVGKHSHYHFLLRDWNAITDLDILHQAFGTAYFRQNLQPLQADISKFKRVLVLAPHQDDESIGCGGLLHLLIAQGTDIRVLFTTDGAQSNLGVSPAKSVALRSAEAELALKEITNKIDYLDIDNLAPRIEQEHQEKLLDVIQETRPDLILLPWMLDAPIKHRLINYQLASLPTDAKMNDIAVWGYQVHNHLPPNIILDISSVVEDKRKMLAAYRSQNEKIIDYNHLTIGLNAFNSRYLRGSRYVEIFFGLPLEEYTRLTREWYERDFLAAFKGNVTFADNMRHLANKGKER